MKRSIIIAKCIGVVEKVDKTFLTFDKPLNNLCSKFVYIKTYLGTLLPNDILEIRASNTSIEANKYYKIAVYNEASPQDTWGWKVIMQSREDYNEETVLLWQELGSLVDPPIEAIDLYIEELNKRT